MQARAMRKDGEVVGEQERELGEHKLVLGEHGNGFSFGVFLQGFAKFFFFSLHFYFCYPFL